MSAHDSAPSYHDLYVTTNEIKRTRIIDLPYDYGVVCSRLTGWFLTATADGPAIATEYDGPERGLRLDVAGHVIVDSLTPRAETD